MTVPERSTWTTSDRPLARYVVQPVARFLDVEAAGGILLLAATAAALMWANSPWSAGYHQLWHTTIAVEAGPLHLAQDLVHWVNDGLMAVFFFVVGLEIKRELMAGQLADVRDATLPVIAALGGMAVPAVLFLAVNIGGDGAKGWGIPMATDIAFALGILVLLGDRVPASLKVLLLGLAVADDIGAIVVIAVFYTEQISLRWLLGAVAGLVLVAVMRRAHVWFVPAYVAVGTIVWACTLESGIHATIAGVVLGLLTPARPLRNETDTGPIAEHVTDRQAADREATASEVREVGFELRESVSVAERLETALHPWTSYVVIPLFALANAGIPLSSGALRDAASSRITIGVVVGLVAGKLVGVSAFAWLAVRSKLARLPDGVSWSQVMGMAALAGVGFTVSIFVAGLAYGDVGQQDEAKIGVLVASAAAAGLGVLLLLRSTRGGASSSA